MAWLHADLCGYLDAHRPDRAWELAASAYRDDDPRLRHYARNLLHYLAPRLPAAAWTQGRQELCRDVGADCPASVAQVGVAHFPVVAGDRGHFVTVYARVCSESSMPGAVDDTTKRAIADALSAARATVQRDKPLEIRFSDTHWSGGSCGLAVALAACSALTNQPLSPTLSATARVKPTGEVVAVDHLDAKLNLRSEAQPRGQLLVARQQASAHLAVVAVMTLQEALEHLRLNHPDDVAESLAEVRKLDRQGDWRRAAQRAETLFGHADLDDIDRLALLAVALTAANHDADSSRQHELLERFDALVAHDTSVEAARAIAALAVAELDLGHARRAESRLAACLHRDFRQAAGRVHLVGTLALVRTWLGDHVGAEQLRRENRLHSGSEEEARCCGDHADALRRLGRLDQALQAVEEGLQIAETLYRRRGYQRNTTVFLELHRARIWAAMGRDDDAASVFERIGQLPGLDPAVRARLELAVVRQDRDAVLRERKDNGPVIVDSLIDRALALLGDADAESRLRGLLDCPAPLLELVLRIPY